MFKALRRYLIKLEVLEEESKKYCKLYLDPYQNFGSRAETTERLNEEGDEIERISALVNRLGGWIERRVYRKRLKIYRKALKQKYRNLERKEIEKQVRGNIMKVEDVDNMLDLEAFQKRLK